MELEEELKQINYEIRRLKVQYDLYFAGNLGRPPNDQREALARQLRRFQGVEMRNLADRFLYNNVVNKFNTFVELWAKMLRNKEEGARVHPLAARVAHRSAAAEAGGSSQPSPPAPPPRPAAPKAKTAQSFRIAPDQDAGDSLRGLYDSYIEARQAAGDTRAVSYESFAKEVTRQAAAIKGKALCEAVEFRIYSQDKKVTVKARPAG